MIVFKMALFDQLLTRKACVSINNLSIENVLASGLVVSPNPTGGHVTVTMTVGTATVQVLDIQGKVVYATSVVSGDKIDLSHFESGVYILNFTSSEGTAIQRVVKQ